MKYSFNFIIISLLTFFVSCNQKKNIGENKMWKFRGGYSIGDVFRIGNNYSKINNDTIYQNEKPVAIVVNFERRVFGDNILTIKSLTENRIGEYCEK
jgi:hypothetical protein